MGVTEEAGKIGAAAVAALHGTPLAIVLLIVNAGFLAVAVYVLGMVATNAAMREKVQMEMIGNLIRDCRLPNPRASLLFKVPQ